MAAGCRRAETDRLLRCYQLPVAPSRLVTDAGQAVTAAAELGGHVALKAEVPGLVHKSDAGAVLLDLASADEVRAAFGTLAGRFAGRQPGRLGVLVQPMITGGIEVIIGVVQEPVFGPLVVFGLGGVATQVLDDHAARLAPLTRGRRRRPDPLDPGRAAAARRAAASPPADLAALRGRPAPGVAAGR